MSPATSAKASLVGGLVTVCLAASAKVMPAAILVRGHGAAKLQGAVPRAPYSTERSPGHDATAGPGAVRACLVAGLRRR